MAFIFKKTLIRWTYQGERITAAKAKRLAGRGKPVEKVKELSRKWYIRLRLPNGRVREFAGFTDKRATLSYAAELERDAERLASGLTRPSDKLLRDAVGDHLDEFRRDLEAKGRSRDHVSRTLSRIRKVFSLANIEALGDIRPQAILDAVLSLEVGTETRNHHLVACKAFSRWLWRSGRLADDPLAGLSRWNAEVDRRIRRRVLSVDELGRLVGAAEQSRWVFRGLTGPDRAALYLLAGYSGLRAAELASLTRGALSIETDQPTVTVEAAYAKNKRQDVVPLPENVAEYLRQWLSTRPTVPVPTVRLWPGTWFTRAARMIAHDLRDAGIPPETEAGRLDFHSLRGTYATLLARVGVNLQTAQALMRHSDPKLTARTYTKLGVTDLGETVRKLAVAVPRHDQKKAADD
ncbi:tyrosine-type recombinase/integrase [Thermopirellula anaerolimosa]